MKLRIVSDGLVTRTFNAESGEELHLPCSDIQIDVQPQCVTATLTIQYVEIEMVTKLEPRGFEQLSAYVAAGNAARLGR